MNERWRRRRFLRDCGLATVAWTAACRRTTDEAGARPRLRPNVLLITMDDMGWKSLPAYGNAQLRTPAFDRLAREGVVMTHAFNTSSSCSSSRATFATGQYVQTHGLGGLVHLFPDRALRAGTPTIASELRDAGYRTGLMGKWHISRQRPQRLGYEENLNTPGADSNRFYDVDKAVDFMRRHVVEGWFLEINFMQTHLVPGGVYPMDPDYVVKADDVRLLPSWMMPDWSEIRTMAAAYFSQVRRADAMVGDLLAALDELGAAGDTFVVLLSDNGIPFPGHKKTLFDRGIGTPFVVRWPKRIPAGRVSSALVSTVDLAPTIVDAVGRPARADMDGTSILSVLEGTTQTGRSAIFAAIDAHTDELRTRAVRTERYKLIRNFDQAPVGLGQLEVFEWAHRLCQLPNQPWLRPRTPAEFYDLTQDPFEQRNLIDDPDFRSAREQLESLLATHMRDVRDPLLPLM